jgi:hypothetical protein
MSAETPNEFRLQIFYVTLSPHPSWFDRVTYRERIIYDRLLMQSNSAFHSFLSLKPKYFLGTLFSSNVNLRRPLGRQTKFHAYIKAHLILAVSSLKPHKISHISSIKRRPSSSSLFFYWHWHHLELKHADKLQKCEVNKRCCFRHAVLPLVSQYREEFKCAVN